MDQTPDQNLSLKTSVQFLGSLDCSVAKLASARGLILKAVWPPVGHF